MNRLLITALMTVVTLSAHAADQCSSFNDDQANAQGAFYPHDHQLMTVIGKGRVQVYSAPMAECKMTEIFIIPGDQVAAFVEHKGFASVQYTNLRTGKTVEGWINAQRLAESKYTSSPAN
jgi:hypothetical protein